MTRIPAMLLGFALVFTIAAPADGAERASCPDDIPRAPYSDVYPLSPHAFDIDCLHWRAVTPDGDAFSPTANLARWQMASWLDSAIGWTQARYADPPQTFVDILNAPGAESIEALRQIGVTKGVTADRFDPYGAIPRWQMALFITRAIEASGSQLPASSVTPFTDIAGETPEARLAIEQLAATGITRGTSSTTFSPDSPVTKEQMASFVARMLEYIWVIDVRAPSCDFGTSPAVCTGSISATTTGDTKIRVALFMAEHIGSIERAEALFGDPTTKVELLVNGLLVESTFWMRTHPGAVYAYWAADVNGQTTGVIEVMAQIYLEGTHAVDRVVTIRLD